MYTHLRNEAHDDWKLYIAFTMLQRSFKTI